MPIKSFAAAKARLAPALSPGERAVLARALAASVLDAAGDLPVAVACDDTDVAAWASARGALVVWTPDRGLDGAVADGVEALAARGAARVVVAHADLPLATDLGRVARFEGVTLVPDRHNDGTNVLCVPAGVRFPFSYGPRSFSRHAAAALTLQLPLRILREPSLGADVDVPGDLALAGTVRLDDRR